MSLSLRMHFHEIIYFTLCSMVFLIRPSYSKLELGCSWSSTNSPKAQWDIIKNSPDGMNIVASSSKLGVPWIYSSSNMGINWGIHHVPSEFKIKSLDVSEDLKYFLYADGHNSYFSESGGQSFKSLSHLNAKAVAMSYDGSIQLSVNDTHLMESKDNWKTVSITRFANGKKIALSRDGKSQIISNDHLFFKSSNYGKIFNDNWIAKFEGMEINDITCNKDCSKVMIGTNNGVFISKNLVSFSIIAGMEVNSLSVGMSDDSSVFVSTNDNLNYILGAKTNSKNPILLLTDPDPLKKGKLLKSVAASSNVILAADYNNGIIYKCMFSNILPRKRNKKEYHMLNIVEEEEYHTIPPITSSTTTVLPQPVIKIIYVFIPVYIPVYIPVIIVIYV